jgi:hypothetical protein
MGQAGQEVDLVGPELGGGPGRDRVGDGGGAAAGQVDQFPVGVATDPHHLVAQVTKAVEHLDRQRTGRDVSGQDDPGRRHHIGFGQHRDRGQHRPSLGGRARTGNPFR